MNDDPIMRLQRTEHLLLVAPRIVSGIGREEGGTPFLPRMRR